ncbi:MAG: LamG domain-containing protein [Sedimentisphaerales bacterium]|nr:LamG domain-containing protein [Sedimentisphaerales bacterium]
MMYKKIICLILLVSFMAINTPAQERVVIFSDDFETAHDYVADNVAGTGWDGYFGWLPGESVDSLNANMDRPGQLYIQSSNGTWDAPWDPLAPFIYKYVEGDFIATVLVSDYAGTASDWVFHNDGGLMARASKADPDDEAGPGEDWVSIDYFPIWNCGNFVWTANNNVRREQCNNGKRFNLDPYLQLERKGNTFHFRTSSDGVTYTEITCSPITRDDFEGLPLQVGLRQAIYNSGSTGYVAFDNFTIEQIIQLKAFDPVPADGTPDVTEAVLEWQAGDTAAWHDIYFGTDPDALDFVVRNTLAQTTYTYGQDLVPGTTYYWRIDEVEADGETIHTGDVWNFQAIPLTAWNPDPSDGIGCVLTDSDLSWSAGSTAERHDVYFGTDEAAVAAATIDSPEFKGNQSATTFTPAELLDGTTYYWRIDEVEAGGATKHTGSVWSFTTLEDIPVSDPSLVGWWKLDGSCDGTLVVDSSGFDRHGSLGGNPQWIVGYSGGALEFDGRDDYVDLPIGSLIGSLTNSSFAVWANFANSGGAWQRIFDFGNDTTTYMFLTPRIYFIDPMRFAITTDGGAGELVVDDDSTLPSGWHHVAVTINADIGAVSLYLDGEEVASNTEVSLKPSDLGETTNNWLGRSQTADDAYYMGALDDFRIYNYVLTVDGIKNAMRGDPLLAWNPTPENGSTPDAEGASPMSWTPGDNAAQHDVYFGTDQEAVEQADASDTSGIYRGRQDPNSYTPPEELQWSTTYYWRIDEYNNDQTISKGNVWNFTTLDYLIVDDFESYNDLNEDLEGSNRIFYTWVDGYENPAVNGSTMGYPNPVFGDGEHFVETNIVHSGYQSAPFFYENSAASYSDVTASTSNLVIGQDWTKGDVQVLMLWFYGDADNDITEQLYISLNGQKVAYDGNASNLAAAEWIPWPIELSKFGINLANVTEISIRLERIGSSRGSGLLFIDDIRLYQVAP